MSSCTVSAEDSCSATCAPRSHKVDKGGKQMSKGFGSHDGKSANTKRWLTVGGLSGVSLAVLAVDVIVFGRNGGTGLIGHNGSLGTDSFVVELALLTFLVVAAITVHKPSWLRLGRGTPPPASKGAGGPRRPVAAQRGGASRGHAPRGSGGAEATQASSAAVRHRSAALLKLHQAIEAAAQKGDMERAAGLLREFEAIGGTPEIMTYNLVIRACARAGDADAAEKWLRTMKGRGMSPTLCSFNTLLDACAKANRAEACESWLEHMTTVGLEPNVISYATAIYSRARRGDVVAAEGWLQRMKNANIEPDAVSYNTVIHAHSVKGNAEGAEKWLEEMRSHGLETSVATYTTVIDACAKAGDVPRAERWLETMIRGGLEPNVVTFSAMIDACAKSGNLPRAEYWHDKMLECGIAPNAHSYSAVINACAKAAGPSGAEAAERWLDISEQAGVVSDVVIYSSVIDACGKAGDAERALRVFNRMRTHGLKPHIVAYAALARPFAYRGDWIKVESIAQSMSADGISVNEYFLYAQLLAYAVARPRQQDRAEECFRKALKVGVEANDHVVGVLARAVGRPRCIELMDELCGGREVPVPPPRRGADRGGDGAGARPRRAAGAGNGTTQ